MLTAIVAVALAQGGQPLFNQVFPRPTGKNGYEEYVMAADIVQSPDFGKTLGETLPDSGSGRDYLAVVTDLVTRYGRACELVRAGNRKPILDPRPDKEMETPFPELSGLKNVTRLLCFEAYVEYGKGNSAAGLTSVLDCLAFADRIEFGTIIQFLVGVAFKSMGLAELDRHLSQLSLKDAERLESYCRQALKNPTNLGKCLQGEIQYQRKAFGKIAAGQVSNLSDLYGVEEPEEDPLMERFLKLPPTERDNVGRLAVSALSNAIGGYIRLLEGPEQNWKYATPKTNNEFADRIISVLSPVYENLTTAAIRERTLYRLSLLHARIIEYRWKNSRLPEKLGDAADAKDILDPANGSEFVYEHDRDNYTLFSKGTTTGSIYLRPRRAAQGFDPSDVPPPMRFESK